DLHETLDTQAAVPAGTDEQVLGFDPADRGGELPGQQLDEQGAGELLLLACCRLEVGEDLADVRGVDDLSHGLDELTGELEGTGHQVRDVATNKGLQIQFGRDEGIQVLTEGTHAVT